MEWAALDATRTLTTAALPPTPEPSLADLRPLRLLFVGHEATRTGAPIALLHLMRWVRDHLHWPFSCVLQQGGEMEDDFHAMCPTVVADRGHWHAQSWRHRLLGRLGLPRLAPWLNTRTIREHIARADVLYANTLDTTPTLRLADGVAKPLVSHVHELEYTIRSHVGSVGADKILARSDRVIACAQAVADNLVSNHGLPREQIEVVHEYIPVDGARTPARTFRDELGIGREDFVVGAAGVMGWRKGTDLFLQLARCVQAQATNRAVHFVWLGGRDGSHEHEQFLYDARLLGLAGSVKHMPSRRDPWTFFEGLDLFLLPSREDPYPLVCLEAAACGVPLVCFAEAGGMPEFVGGDAGFTVPYMDLQAMAAAVWRLRDDESLRRSLGEGARRKVRADHDVAAAAPKIVRTIYQAWEARR